MLTQNSTFQLVHFKRYLRYLVDINKNMRQKERLTLLFCILYVPANTWTKTSLRSNSFSVLVFNPVQLHAQLADERLPRTSG